MKNSNIIFVLALLLISSLSWNIFFLKEEKVINVTPKCLFIMQKNGIVFHGYKVAIYDTSNK